VPTIESLLSEAPRELQFETQLLLAATLNWSRSKVLAYGETEISVALLPALQAQLDRLRSGEPLAYITGLREFYGLKFEVTPDVLIPRPDTELLVELALRYAGPDSRIADLGTGCGAIAISLAHSQPGLSITATDNSVAALKVAMRNADRLSCNVKFIRSHWFDQLPDEYDLIVSNPPYIRRNDPHLSALQHEPAIALIAEDNGLADIHSVIAGASKHLSAEGVLLIEHGYDQAEAVANLFKKYGFVKVELHRDLANQPRVTSGSTIHAART